MIYKVKIYGLTDSDQNIFYVGCTSRNLVQRLGEHLTEINRYCFTNRKKLLKIKALKFNVFIKLLEEKEVDAASGRQAQKQMRAREVYWINKLLKSGHEVLNDEVIQENINNKLSSRSI